jgi:transposase-like protein
MNRVPRARYTKEFREEAVKLAEAVGASEASRRLSIPLKSLANWQQAAKAGKLEEVGRQQKPQTELEAELQRTKRELAEVKMERDLLKNLSKAFTLLMR